MSDLAEFLLARISEDEDFAHRRGGCDCSIAGLPLEHGYTCPIRILVDCAARRRMVDAFRRCVAVIDKVVREDELEYVGAKMAEILAGFSLKLMALQYAGHSDYDQAWASPPPN